MPRVLTQGGFRVMIFPNDHAPAHVHVFDADGEVLINLGGEDEGPSIRENRVMRIRNTRRALRLVEDHQEMLLAEWRRWHG
jgi:hypothetical protein